MTNKPRITLVLAIVVMAALVGPALAGSAGAGPDPNLASAFARLGFGASDMEVVYDNTWDVAEPTLYRFGASLDPPSLSPTEAPWAVPERIGVTWVSWPDEASVPVMPDDTEVIEGALHISRGGPMAGTEYVVVWAQMGGPIPIEPPMDLYENWSFPFAAPGSPTWEPLEQFPYDTWSGASSIPNLTYGPDPFDLMLTVVAPDGTLVDQPFEGFGLISGDTIIVGVDRATMFPGSLEGVTYGFAGHVHDGGFGATPDSLSLVSYATGLPGNLIPIPPPSLLEVGSTPPSTTVTSSPTSTTAPTTTTTAPTTTTTVAGGEVPQTSSGFPWIPLLLALLGITIIVVGGRMFLLAPDDPCAEALLAWQKAHDACEKSKDEAREAFEACRAAGQAIFDLEKQHKDICAKWPPACEEEGASAEESGHPESRVTSRDLHARRIALGRLWADYRAGDISAQDVEEAWKRADTPEFREQMREATAKKIAEREKLESDLDAARKKQKQVCDAARVAAEAARSACDRAKTAKRAYDDCVSEKNAQAFVDGVMGLGGAASAPAEPTPPPESPRPSDAPAAEEADPLAGRQIGVPVTFVTDKSGLSGDELTRAEKLDRIFKLRRGSGDLAAVALDLWQFNNWHVATFGEPWFSWSTAGGNPTSPTSTSATTTRFMGTRVMACYEFVHFCAYIASDQLGRQRVEGDDDNMYLSDEYSVDWGFPDLINTDTSPLTGQAPRGSVITGSFRWGDYDNTAGYYHTGISIGDGKVISLGSDGLILEDATGAVDACFPSVGYTNVQYGSYAYSGTNPAPK